jgi:FeS assembly SUF system protein
MSEISSAERRADFLDGFLEPPPPPPPLAAPGGAPDHALTEADAELRAAVIAALRDIYDPEIPVNIYDLGLVYGVAVENGHVTITMTLTTPHCPVAETMPGEVETRASAVPGVGAVEVKLVWEPAWSPASMSDEARLELGML